MHKGDICGRDVPMDGAKPERRRLLTINLGVMAVFIRDLLTIAVLIKLLKYL